MSAMTAIRRRCRILIVDDHPLVRHGIKESLRGHGAFEVVGEASGQREALELVAETTPDLVVADLSLKEGSGLELVRELREKDASIRVLVSSMHDESIYGERALRAGAMGYVTKDHGCETLLEALQTIRDGGVFLSENLSNRMILRMVSPGSAREEAGSPMDRLSDRELEVFEILGSGATTRETAKSLGLSVKTVETYRENIKDKLSLENNNELICCAAHWVASTSRTPRAS